MNNPPLPPNSGDLPDIPPPTGNEGPDTALAKTPPQENQAPVHPADIPELRMLAEQAGEEETLSLGQEAIRQLVYAKGIDFFTLQPRNQFPFDSQDRTTKPLNRNEIRRKALQYEISASILNGIALNSSDDPEEQTANQQALINVFNRYGSNLHEFSFHNKQHNINTLGLSDLEKKTLGKLIIARTITRANDHNYFNGILNIHSLVGEDIIAPKDIIEAQNIVMSTVKDAQNKDKSLRLDVSDIVKQMKSYESHEDGKEQRRSYSERGEKRTSTALLEININRFEPGGRNEFPPLWINPNNIDVNARYEGVAPMYVIDGEQFSSPQVAPSRVRETLEVMDRYIDMHNLSVTQSPDFIQLMQNVESTSKYEEYPSDDTLEELITRTVASIENFAYEGTNRIAGLEYALQRIAKLLTRTDLKKGGIELGNKNSKERRQIAEELSHNKIITELLGGIEGIEGKIVQILEAGGRPELFPEIKEKVANEQENIHVALREILQEFRKYNPTDNLTNAGILDESAAEVKTAENGTSSSISILDATDTSALGNILRAYKPISNQYGQALQSLYDDHQFLNKLSEFGITLGSNGFVMNENRSTTQSGPLNLEIPQKAKEKFLKNLTRLYSTLVQGRSGQRVGEKLKELYARKAEEVRQQSQNTRQELFTLFPGEVVGRMGLR